MSDRIRAILTGEDGRAMPMLAEHLAFSSDVTAEQAQQIFAAVRKDMETTATAPQVPQQPQQSQSTSARQTSGLGLGVAERVGGDNDAEVARAGWKKAIERINANF